MKITALLVLGLALTTSSGLRAAWTEVSIPGDVKRPQAMISFNGLYIAVGYNAEIITSTDGMTWTLQSVDADPIDPAEPDQLPAFRAIAASDSLIVVCGDRDIVATSTNGTDWTVTQQATPDGNGMYGIAYGNGIFMASNFSQSVLTSTDGATWTERTVTGATETLRNVTFTDDEFIVIPSNGNMAYLSSNGTSWESFTSNLSDFFFIEAFGSIGDNVFAGGNTANGPGLAYASDTSGFMSSTLDGAPDKGFITGFASGQGVVAASGGNFFDPQVGYIFASSDNGVSFVLDTDQLSHVANDIVYANGLWVIIGEGYAAYTDSISGGSSAPYLTVGAVDLGDGWYETWIGTLNLNSWPWAYSSVGWFYAGNAGNTNADSWFFFINPQIQGWVYASENTPSWVYAQPPGQPQGWWFVDGESTDGFTLLFGPNGQVITIEDEF